MNRAIFALALALISIKGGNANDGDLTLDLANSVVTTNSITGIKVLVEDGGDDGFVDDSLDTTVNLYPTSAKVPGTAANDDSEVFGFAGLHPGTLYTIEITAGTVTTESGGVAGASTPATLASAQIGNFVTEPVTPNPDENLKVLSTNGTGEMCVMWYVSKKDTSHYTKIGIETVDTEDANINDEQEIAAVDEDAGIKCMDMTGFTADGAVQFKMQLTTEVTDTLKQIGSQSGFGANTKNLAESNQGIKAEKVADSCYYDEDEWSCLIKVMPDYLGDGMDEMLDYHYTIEDADASQVDHHDDCSTSTGTKPVRTCEHWVTGMEKEDHDYTMKFTKVCVHGKTPEECVDFPDEAAYHYTFKSSAVSIQAVGVLGMTLIAFVATKFF